MAERPSILLLGAGLLLALLAPPSAGAATVVNGNFESGALSGWHHLRVTEAGNWFAYQGTEAPIGKKRGAEPVQAPPQGNFAAIADQANPETLFLYQDVALEPGQPHFVHLLAYYDTYEPIAVPAPDTLSVDEEVLAGQANQQFRIEVIDPAAPIDTVDPNDILATVYRTRAGAATRLRPTEMIADLSAFAGRTVRLRIATATHEEVLNAGVDAISITRSAESVTSSSGRLSLGKPRPNRRTGTVTLPVRVPDAGLLQARGARIRVTRGGRRGGGARKGKAIRYVSRKVGAAGTVPVRLRPTRLGRGMLEDKRRLRVKVTVIFEPARGSREVASTTVLFRLTKHSAK